jgi:hypothetical protein
LGLRDPSPPDKGLSGPVVRRRLEDATAATGEAQFTLLKMAVPEVMARYEATLRVLARAESVRLGKPVLESRTRGPTFGQLEKALSNSLPPKVRFLLRGDAHKLRNAFAHANVAHDVATGSVTLRDTAWERDMTQRQLLEALVALADASNVVESTLAALAGEHMVDLLSEQLSVDTILSRDYAAALEAFHAAQPSAVARVKDLAGDL